MSNLKGIVGSVAALIAMLLLTSTPAAAKVLSGPEINRVLVGKTIYGQTRNGGSPWRFHMVRGGTVVFHFASGLVQRGSYRVSGDKICFTLPNVPVDCRIVRYPGGSELDWVLAEDRRTVTSVLLRVADGDPHGLLSLSSGSFYPIVSLGDKYELGEHQDPGQSWVQVYSRPSIAEAQLIAQQVKMEWPYTEIFLARNGWYAVAIGQVKSDQAEGYLNDWKVRGRIPFDSLAVTGQHYRHRIPVSSYQGAGSVTAYTGRAPASGQTGGSAQRTSRPQACRRISDFCIELAAAAAGCGFIGQEAIDSAAGQNTGAVGGAVSSLACTALLSEMSGLGVDATDLLIAGVGGVAGDAAVEALKEGDLETALFAGLIAFGGGYVSALRCEDSMRRQCR